MELKDKADLLVDLIRNQMEDLNKQVKITLNQTAQHVMEHKIVSKKSVTNEVGAGGNFVRI